MNNDYLVANEVIHQWFLSVMFYITDKNHWWMSSFASKLFTVKHRSIYLLLTRSPQCLSGVWFHIYVHCRLRSCEYSIIFQWPMWCLYDRIVRPIIMISSKLCISGPLMMASSNGNIFRVTGHLCGELTGFMFTLICARVKGWINNREAGDLICHRAHYDVIVMEKRNIVT